MKLSSFITTCQAWINQVATNFIVTQDSLIQFINLALTDIYIWHRWSWRRTIISFDVTKVSAVQADLTYKITLTIPCDFPIALINDTENTTDGRTEYLPANSLLLIEDNQFYVWALDNLSLTLASNWALNTWDKVDWKFEYASFFTALTLVSPSSTNLPIPDSFTSILWNLVMSYAAPAVVSDEQNNSPSNYRQIAVEMLKKHTDADVQFHWSLAGNPFNK